MCGARILIGLGRIADGGGGGGSGGGDQRVDMRTLVAFRGKGGHFWGKKAAGGSLGLQGWLLEEKGVIFGKKNRRRQPGPARLAFRGNLL